MFSCAASLLTSDRHGKDIIGIDQGLVAADALAAESFVLAVRLQVRTTPSRPAPPESGGIFGGVSGHELHLKKRAGARDAFRVDLVQPSYRGESLGIGSGVAVMCRE